MRAGAWDKDLVLGAPAVFGTISCLAVMLLVLNFAFHTKKASLMLCVAKTSDDAMP